MRKFLPLAGIGCVAIVVLALIVGGAIMIGYGVSNYIDNKKKDGKSAPVRKSWVVPKDGIARLPHGGTA
jgi:hypothetical protein